MSLNLQIINPITYPGWDDLLLSNPDYSFFHSSSWARVLSESYNYVPLYFALIKENRLLVLISVMEVKGFITGKRGVSLPFTDYVDPIVAGDIKVKDVINYPITYGRRAGWKSIEIRGGRNLIYDLPHSTYYYGHTLSLTENEEKIFSSLRDSTKRNIKKATKASVKVSMSNSINSIKEFYRLNCMTRREHGLPPQPFYFFRNIYDYIISKGFGFIMLAFYKKRVVAGAIYFNFGRKAIYKYGASDKTHQHLRANNLVMWEAIKWYCQNGYESFCFGKTEPEHKGLLQFKNGWGAEEHIIKYYKYDIENSKFVKNDSLVSGLHNKVFSKIPIPILKVFANLFYKYMG